MKTETIPAKNREGIAHVSIHFDKNDDEKNWIDALTLTYAGQAGALTGEKTPDEIEKYERQENLLEIYLNRVMKKRENEKNPDEIGKYTRQEEVLETEIRLLKVRQGKIEIEGDRIDIYSEVIPNLEHRISFCFPDEKTADAVYKNMKLTRDAAFENSKKIMQGCKKDEPYADLINYASIEKPGYN